MKAHVNIDLLLTPPQPCSYLPDEQATTMFLAPTQQLDQRLYTALAQLGFRRSGTHVYRPHCETCQACVPVRIPVNQFRPRRRHRRILGANREVSVRWVPATLTDEYYDLYERYIASRHGDGDMYPASREQYEAFLLCDWAPTTFLELRDQEQLVAVAVTDVLDDGLSAVYTFFNPEARARSPGVLAILHQIEFARRMNLPHLYLGYWIEAAPKMRYKGDFRPLEQMIGERWEPLTTPSGT